MYLALLCLFTNLFQNALRAYPKMDRRQRYVLYCEFGLKSAHLAEMMQREGLDACHFTGGQKALMALSHDEDRNDNRNEDPKPR